MTKNNKKRARISSNQVTIHEINQTSTKPINKLNQTNLQSASKGTRKNLNQESHSTSTSTSTSTPSSLTKPKPIISKVPTILTTFPPNSIKIVFGSYEHLLYGIQITFSSDTSILPTILPLFHFRAHSAPLTSIAISPSGTHLATASTTGPLTLWSLQRQRALGTLSATSASDDHQPGVSHTSFDPTGRLLAVLDGDENGKLSLYRTRDWVLLNRLPGLILFVGFELIRSNLMLTVGRDRCLRLWDLSCQAQSNRRPIGSVRLGTIADLVQWSPTGDLFVVLTGAIATVYNTKMDPKFMFKSPRGRVHDAKFLTNKIKTTHLILACDDGIGRIFNLNDDFETLCVSELIGHTNRIRAIDLIEIDLILYGITISLDGFCNIYKLEPTTWTLDPIKDEEPKEIKPLLQYDTKGSRVTCLAVTGFYKDVNSKGKTQTEVGDEDFGIDQGLVEDNLDMDSGSDSGSDSN